MYPLAIKGLEGQYTNITTLLSGDTKGYSDNVIYKIDMALRTIFNIIEK